ncbi:MAG TPA: ACP S-malonyltransferase [Candidatus Dormibacteraeota bacterium]|nr:ACP S-malonyltransferase [Candidatus Dormibacteraeota bacterium]
MTRIALCFPGQGSQAAGMAGDLLDDPLAARLLEVAAADGLDLRTALGGSDEQLRPTEIAQPSLVLAELVLAARLPAELEVVGVAGHSVGEYAAVSVAGAYAPEDVMRLVIRRGREMASMTEGTMAAVLGLEAAAVEEACADTRQGGEVVVVANLNAPGQTVISGTVAGVDRAAVLARERGARRVVTLNVSGAFHSPLMAPAAARLAPVIEATPRQELRIPVVCNVDGAIVEHAADIPPRLAAQLEAPVRWTDCVAGLVSLGAEWIVEVGPGSVLTGLTRRIAPTVSAATVGDLAAAAALATLRTAPA